MATISNLNQTVVLVSYDKNNSIISAMRYCEVVRCSTSYYKYSHLKILIDTNYCFNAIVKVDQLTAKDKVLVVRGSRADRFCESGFRLRLCWSALNVCRSL